MIWGGAGETMGAQDERRAESSTNSSGFVAGVTVYIGAVALYRARGSLSNRGLGFPQALAGGIPGYLAFETGARLQNMLRI